MNACTHSYKEGQWGIKCQSYLLSMQSHQKTDETKRNLLYLCVIASKKGEDKKNGRRRKGVDSFLFQNSLNCAAP